MSDWDVSADDVVVVDDDKTLRAAVDKLLIQFTDQEERLRNMANKLDEHINTPDCHNPGVMRRSK